MSETRTYVVQRRLGSEGTRATWESLGEFDAPSPEEAIRDAIAAEDEPGSVKFAAVAKRNWMEIPTQKVQTTLVVGEREFEVER